MKSTTVLVVAFSSRALAGEWKIQRRDVTITSTVYETVIFCPCTTSTPFSSSLSSATNPSISYASNSGSVGSPILTSAGETSSVSTIPSSFFASSSITTGASLLASSSTTSTSTASGAGSTVFVNAASLGDYRSTVLSSHNIHRVNHTVPDLIWSDTMAQYAAQIASSCVYAHSKSAGNGNYGQNIGAGFTPSQIAFMLTNAMYNSEITKFPGPYGSDNVDTSNFGGWGHFSQIVWADTTAVGCATQYCPNGLVNAGPNTPPYFTVCNYFPAGNFLGQWSKVHAPIGNPIVVVVN